MSNGKDFDCERDNVPKLLMEFISVDDVCIIDSTTSRGLDRELNGNDMMNVTTRNREHRDMRRDDLRSSSSSSSRYINYGSYDSKHRQRKKTLARSRSPYSRSRSLSPEQRSRKPRILDNDHNDDDDMDHNDNKEDHHKNRASGWRSPPRIRSAVADRLFRPLKS